MWKGQNTINWLYESSCDDSAHTLYWHMTSILWKMSAMTLKVVCLCLQTATSCSLDSVISASRKHTCLQCGKSFSNAQSIRLHEPMHSGIYPYRCDICHQGIVSTSNYRRHMAMHKGTRDHKCPVCLLAFTCAWSLKRHIRQVHCHTDNFEWH